MIYQEPRESTSPPDLPTLKSRYSQVPKNNIVAPALFTCRTSWKPGHHLSRPAEFRSAVRVDHFAPFGEIVQALAPALRSPAIAPRGASVSFVSDLQGHIQRFRNARTRLRGTQRGPALTAHFKRIQIAAPRSMAIRVCRGGLYWRCCQEVTRIDWRVGEHKKTSPRIVVSDLPARSWRGITGIRCRGTQTSLVPIW